MGKLRFPAQLPLILGILASAGNLLASTASPCGPVLSSQQSVWAAADFDGNGSVDVATLRPSRDRFRAPAVELFGFCANPHLSAIPGQLVLSASDIDHDHDPDLILRESFGGKTVGVWLNDGAGRFSVSPAATFPNAADDPPSLRSRLASTQQLIGAVLSKTCATTPTHAAFAPLWPHSQQIGAHLVFPALFAPHSHRPSRAPPILFL